MTKSPRWSIRYWWRLVRLFLICSIIAVIAIPIVGGISDMLHLTKAGCGGDNTNLDNVGDFVWDKVTIEAKAGGKFSSFYIHGTNGATIIIPPSYSAPATHHLSDANILVKHGYSVIIYDSRRCGQAMPPLSLGYQEVSEVEDVLDYLRQRGDVDMNRIGLIGFSSAGATSIMAAAKHPEIKAVVAKGNYADMDEILMEHGANVPGFLYLYRWAMRQTYRVVTGESFDKLSPLDVIDEIAPCSILLVYGSLEPSLAGAYRLVETAGINAELWVVEGAGHGNYSTIASNEYEKQIVGFFDRVLLDVH